jgi:hypothetical protein
MLHHPGAHKVQLNISVTPEKVSLFTNKARTKSSLPACARAPITAVYVLHIPLTQLLHRLLRSIAISGRQQKVGMVGHQYIGMKINPLFLVSLAEMVKIELVIIFRKEAGASIVASLDDMDRNCGKLESWPSRHV